MSWLLAVRSADDLDLAEAAAFVVEAGVVISAREWAELGPPERAAIIAARRVRATAELRERLLDQGRDLDAARLDAPLDGGVAFARLAAEAAVQGLSRAALEARRGSSG